VLLFVVTLKARGRGTVQCNLSALLKLSHGSTECLQNVTLKAITTCTPLE